MDLLTLQKKLKLLQERLHRMETVEAEIIRQRRIDSDMGDDYRENEQAKMVMQQHDVWYIRKVAIKKEIHELKRQIVRHKQV